MQRGKNEIIYQTYVWLLFWGVYVGICKYLYAIYVAFYILKKLGKHQQKR